MPTLKPYTLPSRSKSPSPEPKLVDKYVCPNPLTGRPEEGTTDLNKVYESLGSK